VIPESLSSPLFSRVLAVLGTAFTVLYMGVAVRAVRRRRHPDVPSLLVPVVTATVVILLVVFALIGSVATATLLALFVSLAASFEFARLAALPKVYTVLLLTGGVTITTIGSWLPGVGATLAPLVALFLIVASVPIVSGNVDGATGHIGACLFAACYIQMPLALLVEIRAAGEEGLRLLLLMTTVVAVTDAAAYIVGKRLGGPKLAESVSPNKTWAGAVGGLAIAMIASGLVIPSLYDDGATDPTTWSLMPLALAISLLAIWSDLVESVVKRVHGVKDAGTMLPGFGGVLDRFDSFLLPLYALTFWGIGAGHVSW
jgi:phosphatidate cytidylyltransferase